MKSNRGLSRRELGRPSPGRAEDGRAVPHAAQIHGQGEVERAWRLRRWAVRPWWTSTPRSAGEPRNLPAGSASYARNVCSNDDCKALMKQPRQPSCAMVIGTGQRGVARPAAPCAFVSQPTAQHTPETFRRRRPRQLPKQSMAVKLPEKAGQDEKHSMK